MIAALRGLLGAHGEIPRRGYSVVIENRQPAARAPQA